VIKNVFYRLIFDSKEIFQGSKKRNGLVTRAHTYSQSIPGNARELAINFIKNTS